MDCLFCYYDKKDYIAENKLVFAIFDKFSVNKGHALIIPKRHFDNFFHASEEEVTAIYSLLHEVKSIVDKKITPSGYNVGYDGGQTIMHLHVHLIPRYKGDIENLRGGVRKLKRQLVEGVIL